MRELRAEAGRWAGRASREDSDALLRTEIKVGLVALVRGISYFGFMERWFSCFSLAGQRAEWWLDSCMSPLKRPSAARVYLSLLLLIPPSDYAHRHGPGQLRRGLGWSAVVSTLILVIVLIFLSLVSLRALPCLAVCLAVAARCAIRIVQFVLCEA